MPTNLDTLRRSILRLLCAWALTKRFNFGVSEVVSFCTDLQLYVVWEGFWTFLE